MPDVIFSNSFDKGLMIYRSLADFVLILHFCFVLFVVFGGLLVLRRRLILWLHLPAVAWGILVEFFLLPCPLTELENQFKQLGGEQGYEGGFIEYYVSAILYLHISPQLQMMLGVLLVAINLLIYWYVFKRAPRLKPS
jgi:hypothetical protein